VDYAGPRDVDVAAQVAAAICEHLGYPPEMPLGAKPDAPILDLE
jgi:hypothetical protein